MPATLATDTRWSKSDLWAWRQSGHYSSTLRSSTEMLGALKTFIAFYIIFLLTVSASLFSIKTAALLWFLYGTLNNQNRAGRIDVPGTLPGAGSEGEGAY